MNRSSIPHNIMSSPENENLFDIDVGETRRKTRESALRAVNELTRNIKTGTHMEVIDAIPTVTRTDRYGTGTTSSPKFPHERVA